MIIDMSRMQLQLMAKFRLNWTRTVFSSNGGYKMQKLKQDINIGQNIKAIRVRLGFTQSHVVAQMQLLGCNLSRMTYSKMERGVYNIRVSELLALSIIYAVDFNSFFVGLI